MRRAPIRRRNILDGDVYTLDAAGNRTAKQDDLAGVTSNYTYDPIYELTQVQQANSTTESYSYDPVGNRLSSLSVASYTVNSSNELTGSSDASYTYDQNGNTTSKTDSTGTTNYTWDFENRLVSVTLPGSGGSATFKYDPFGRRIYKSSSSGTTIYAYDGNDIVETTNQSGTILLRFAQGDNIDNPLAESTASGTYFYQQDGLGSVTSLTNGAAQLAQTYTYDSFGNTTNSSGNIANPFRYTGRDFDSESGLYYYRARYYDPAVGRFLSEDPWDADPMYEDSNLYMYVENNPTNGADPFGLHTLKPGVPPPSPALDKFLNCLENYVRELGGNVPLVVTSTTNGKHQDPGHKGGTSVDIRPPGVPSNKLFCAAGKCGAKWGLKETPGNQSFKFTQGYNDHFQLVPPHHPSPKAPNQIPPGCTPGGCSEPK